jgi:hypothetical protein
MGPFEHHLREALEINRARLSLYARLSGGRSVGISRRLIRSEQLLLPVAWWFDRRAEPYHRAGVRLLHDVFVAMSDAPAAPTSPGPPCRRDAPPPSSAALRRSVGAGYVRGGWGGAAAEADRALVRLQDSRGADCMLRHLLESVRRIAEVAPAAAEASAHLGLPSPARLLNQLFRLHLWGLAPAARLDRDAYPLQREGIPILCADVPPIPPLPAAPPGRV